MLGMKKHISATQSLCKSHSPSRHCLHPQYVKGAETVFKHTVLTVAGNPISSTVGCSYAVFEARFVTWGAEDKKTFLQKTGSLPLPKCVAQKILTGTPD
jgi:hypothetical protein